MLKKSDLIVPNWPAPKNVHALQTNRLNGVSLAPYDSLNLGSHVNDNTIHVAQNRQLLRQLLPIEPVWLNQVHGINVLNLDDINAAKFDSVPTADASFTSHKNVVCVTMTADCLPILICDSAGTHVASIHAGWRSLCDGVIEATIAKMATDSSQLLAWLGPAIGPDAFEVGSEVRAQFITQDAQAQAAFRPQAAINPQTKQPQPEKWLGNIYQIAKQRLNKLGVTQIYGGGISQNQSEYWCTFSQKDQFFSYRRDGITGRMATLIWLG